MERHGCYKRDLEMFGEALLKRKKLLLFEVPEGAGPQPPAMN